MVVVSLSLSVMSGRLQLWVFFRGCSASDPDAAASRLTAGGRLNQKRRDVRTRDSLRQAPAGAFGKNGGSCGGPVAKHACVDDRPVEVALAEPLLAGALVLDQALHGNAGGEPEHRTY